ncbi:MAG: hypothetical protein ACFFDN_06255 [Candidatus Hodarchaeota archaeon]
MSTPNDEHLYTELSSFTFNQIRPGIKEKKEQRIIWSILLMYILFLTKSTASLLALSITKGVLDPVSFDVWVLLQAIASYLFIFDMGISQIVMNLTGRAYSKGILKDISMIAINALIIYFCISLGVITISLAAINFFHAEKFLVKDYASVSHILPLSLALLISITILRFPFRVFSAVLNGLRALHLRLLVDLLHPFVFIGVIVLTVTITNDMITLIITSTTSVLVVFFLFFPITKRLYPFIKLKLSYFNVKLFKKLLINMFKYAPLPLCLMGQRFFPTFLVSSLDSLSLVPGLYLIVMVYRVIMFFIIDSVSKGFQPYIIYYYSTGNLKIINFLWTLSTKVTTSFSILLVVISFSWYGRLSDILLKEDALLIPQVIAIFAILGILDSIFSPGINNFIAMNKYAKLSILWSLEMFAGVGLGFLSITQEYVPHIVGISFGFLIAKVFISVPGYLILFSRFMNKSVSNFAWKIFGERTIWAYLFFGASMLFIKNILSLPSLLVIIIFNILSFAIFIITFWFYILSSSERKWITERLHLFICPIKQYVHKDNRRPRKK